jgi:predicted XRE-type DNA-binding protein
MEEDIEYTVSCGNVFEDLEVPNPDAMLAKCDIGYLISQIKREGNITSEEMAQILGIEKDRVYNLINTPYKGFTLEELFLFITKLGGFTRLYISRKEEND